MPRPTHDMLGNDWNDISVKAGAASAGVSDLAQIALLGLMKCDETSKEYAALLDVIRRAERAEQVLSGLSYLCTPQTEWLGGEDYVVRAPHIVCDN